MLAVQVSDGEISYVTSASLIRTYRLRFLHMPSHLQLHVHAPVPFLFRRIGKKTSSNWLASLREKQTCLGVCRWMWLTTVNSEPRQQEQQYGFIIIIFFFHTYTVRTLTVTQSELELNRMISKPCSVGVELSRNTESNHLLGENRLTGSLDLIATHDIVKPNQSLYKEFISACNFGLLRPEGSKNTFSF